MSDTGGRSERLPRVAALLGAAGLLPVAGALVAILGRDLAHGGDSRAIIIASAEIGYSVLIFNFLGGLWWGLAARTEPSPGWLYVASIVPTLVTIGLLASSIYLSPALDLMPRFGMAIGSAILLTLPIDWLLSRRRVAPAWWLKLRVPLSLGLGLGTIAVAVLTPF